MRKTPAPHKIMKGERKPKEEPEEIKDAFCAGCQRHGQNLYKVSRSRYRCLECKKQENAGVLTPKR